MVLRYYTARAFQQYFLALITTAFTLGVSFFISNTHELEVTDQRNGPCRFLILYLRIDSTYIVSVETRISKIDLDEDRR